MTRTTIHKFNPFIVAALATLPKAAQHPLTRHRLQAQLWEESKMKPTARSHMGAEGVAQFMPNTWEEWAPKAGFPNASVTDPEASIHAAVIYMDNLYGQWSWPRPEADRWALALASYNAGLGNILEAQRLSGNSSAYRDIINHLPTVTGHNAEETRTYVKRIFKYWTALVVGDM